MAKGIYDDVYTGQMQGIDPQQLEQIARAKAAQRKLSGMGSSGPMQAALRDYNAGPLEVRGQGASAAAPSILESIARGVTRSQGKSKLNEMEQQSQALRGQITQGSIAEQQAKLQAKDYQNKIDAQKNADTAQAKILAAKEKVGANKAAADVKNKRALELAQIKANRGPAPTGKERKSYTDAGRLNTTIDGLNTDFAAMSEEEQEQLNRPYIETAKEWLPTGIGNIIEENFIDTSDKGKRYLTKVAKLESDLSKIASGLAVSGYEMADRKKWSPYAEGISQKERQRRLDNVQINLKSETDAFEQYYPNHTLEKDEVQPSTNTKGWELKVDANGNEAYVSPDGKQYEEVQ